MNCPNVNRSRRSRLCVGPCLLAAVDAALTLGGQSSEYWAGQWSAVREHNPVASWILQLGPGVFCVAVLLWLALVVAAIHGLPIRLARVVAFCVMLGHALGAATWLLHWHHGIILAVGLLVLVRMLDILIKE